MACYSVVFISMVWKVVRKIVLHCSLGPLQLYRLSPGLIFASAGCMKCVSFRMFDNRNFFIRGMNGKILWLQLYIENILVDRSVIKDHSTLALLLWTDCIPLMFIHAGRLVRPFIILIRHSPFVFATDTLVSTQCICDIYGTGIVNREILDKSSTSMNYNFFYYFNDVSVNF